MTTVNLGYSDLCGRDFLVITNKHSYPKVSVSTEIQRLNTNCGSSKHNIIMFISHNVLVICRVYCIKLLNCLCIYRPCVGIKAEPDEDESWFCPKCIKPAKSKSSKRGRKKKKPWRNIYVYYNSAKLNVFGGIQGFSNPKQFWKTA